MKEVKEDKLCTSIRGDRNKKMNEFEADIAEQTIVK